MSDDDEKYPRPEFEEEEDESDEDEEDEMAKSIQYAAEEMERIFKRKVTADDVDRFLRGHGEIVTKPLGSQNGTFLHKITQMIFDRKITLAQAEPLLKRLMEKKHAHLIRTTNDDSHTVLHRAIYLKGRCVKLVDYILSNCQDPASIEMALEWSDKSSRTCLTLAFERGLKDELIRSLVDKASDKALELQDGSERTPFHWAVQYDKCTDERLGVIKRLLQKDSDAIRRHQMTGNSGPIKTFLDYTYTIKGDGAVYSVYNEHQRTAKVYQDQVDKKARESKAREIDQERIETETANITVPMKEKEASKGNLDKGPKSRVTEERDRSTRELDRDRETVGVKQEPQDLDQNERRKQESKEQDKEVQERRAKDKKHPRHQLSERTKQPKDSRDSVDDPASTIRKDQPDHAPNTPLKRSGTQSFGADIEKKRKEKKASLPKKKSPVKGPSPDVLARNSAKLLNMLKLHYMRTRGINEVTSFLYGKNLQKDVQICFDYEGLPSEIQDETFTDRFGKDKTQGIQFDEVLMYVRFPIVNVTLTGRNAPKPRAAGRQDLEFFFKWLHAKGVRRIIRVEVEDSEKIPHSDESIQTSLEGFVVEHLDWQKTDLDPRVICQLSSKSDHPDPSETLDKSKSPWPENQLREVTLKWSGNNAVLRSWGEAEGLPQLERLQTVNLNIPAHSDLFDTWDWVSSNLGDFEARLNRNANEMVKARMAVDTTSSEARATSETILERNGETKDLAPPAKRTIEVRQRQGKKGTAVAVSVRGTPKTSGRLNPMTEHEWLKCMERFAAQMYKLWPKTIERFRKKFGQGEDKSGPLLNFDSQIRNDFQSLQKPVVVALIDDGVDCCDSAFEGRVIEGKTFDYQDGGVGQYYISGRGHGTEMARMILRVCPMASIYSIRLKTHNSPEKGHSTIDAISAALAIDAALEKHVNIISMSWTIPVAELKPEEKRVLDEVLERACKRKVLMFCSSSDNISSPEHYPSAFKRHRFIRIGAAHEDGTSYAAAGTKNDFIFPGVNVNTTRGRSLPRYLADKTSSTEESTGSSIATALAAGLAAMIMYCFKASALNTVAARTHHGQDYKLGTELVRPGDVDKIAEHDVLKTAFKRIGKEESAQFIPVWTTFEPASKELKDESKTDESKIEYITKLCSNLIDR